jgi:PRTRC genetic system protein C
MPITLKVSTLPRTFVFNGSPLPDPDPKMSVEELRELLTPAYPELATAKLTGPEDTGLRCGDLRHARVPEESCGGGAENTAADERSPGLD